MKKFHNLVLNFLIIISNTISLSFAIHIPDYPTPSWNAKIVMDKLSVLSDTDLLKVLLNQKELLGGSSSKCKIKYHPYAAFKYSFEYFDGSNVISETFGTRGISYSEVTYVDSFNYSAFIMNGVSTVPSSYNARIENQDINTLILLAQRFKQLLQYDLWPCGVDPVVEVKNRTPQGLLNDIKFISSNQNEVKCLSSINTNEEEVLLPSQVCSFFYRLARQTTNYVLTLSQEANLSDPDKLSLSNATLKSTDPITFGAKKTLVAPVCGEDFLHPEVRSSVMNFFIWQTYQANTVYHLNSLSVSDRKALFNFYTAYKRSRNGKNDPLPFCSNAALLGQDLENILCLLYGDGYFSNFNLSIDWDSRNSKMWVWTTPTRTWVNENSVTPTTNEIPNYPRSSIMNVVNRSLQGPRAGCSGDQCWFIYRQYDP